MGDELQAHLYELEKRLMHTAEAESAAVYDELLADDFLEFGRSGRIYDKQRIIDELPDKPPDRIAITDFQARPLAPALALVTYRSHLTGVPAPEARHAVRSSIWRLSDNMWRLIFHQGTPTEPE